MNTSKQDSRRRRASRTRHLIRLGGRNRLVAYRSGRHIYAQLLAPDARVLAAASTVEREVRSAHPRGSGCAAAEAVGQRLAAKAKEANLHPQIAFDRGGYAYHGRVRALADGARAGGLEF